MKKVFFTLMTSGLGIAAGFYLYGQKEYNMSDITLQNIEALASSEYEEGVHCYNKGDVDCNGDKVEVKIEGSRR